MIDKISSNLTGVFISGRFFINQRPRLVYMAVAAVILSGVLAADGEANATLLSNSPSVSFRTILTVKAGKTPFKLFVTPWSAPAWMKTNGEICRSNKILAFK